MQEARARYGIVRSQFYPAVDYEGDGNGRAPTRSSTLPGRAQTRWTVEVGFSWELDLWGRIRRLSEAASAQYLATEEGRRGVLLSLVVGRGRGLHGPARSWTRELAIAKSTTAAFQDTYDLVQPPARRAARPPALETARAEASLAQVAAQIPEIERAIVARENQINFLLGRNPQPDSARGPAHRRFRRTFPRAAFGSPGAAARHPAGGAAPDRGQRERRRGQGRLLPAAEPHGFLRQREPGARRLFSSHGKTWSVGAGLAGPDLPGRPDQAQLRGGPGASGSRRRSNTRPLPPMRSAKCRVRSWTGRSSSRPSGSGRAPWPRTRRPCGWPTSATTPASPPTSRCWSPSSSSSRPRSASAQTRRDQLVAVVNLYRALGGGWQAEEKAQAGTGSTMTR